MDEKSRFGELSTEEIGEIMDKAVSDTTKRATKFGMRLFNGKYGLSFHEKLQNFEYDRRDFTHSWLRNNNNIYLNVTEWLASPGGTTFSKPIQKMSKEELNVCLKCFYTSARKKDGTYYKRSSTKSIRAAIDRFLRSLPHNKPFYIISDPAFTEANKVLDALVKDLRKTGKIAGAGEEPI